MIYVNDLSQLKEWSTPIIVSNIEKAKDIIYKPHWSFVLWDHTELFQIMFRMVDDLVKKDEEYDDKKFELEIEAEKLKLEEEDLKTEKAERMLEIMDIKDEKWKWIAKNKAELLIIKEFKHKDKLLRDRKLALKKRDRELLTINAERNPLKKFFSKIERCAVGIKMEVDATFKESITVEPK